MDAYYFPSSGFQHSRQQVPDCAEVEEPGLYLAEGALLLEFIATKFSRTGFSRKGIGEEEFGVEVGEVTEQAGIDQECFGGFGEDSASVVGPGVDQPQEEDRFQRAEVSLV